MSKIHQTAKPYIRHSQIYVLKKSLFSISISNLRNAKLVSERGARATVYSIIIFPDKSQCVRPENVVRETLRIGFDMF